jgi:hypothetical protein
MTEIQNPLFKQLYDSTLTQVLNDPTLFGTYAKKSCKTCNGKGYTEIRPAGTSQFYKLMCACVKKHIKQDILTSLQ